MKKRKRKPRLKSIVTFGNEIPPPGWVSDEEAERRLGVPREVIDLEADQPLRLPLPEDMPLRRRVLLNFWSRAAGTPLWPRPVGMLPIQVLEAIQALIEGRKVRATRQERVAARCWLALMVYDPEAMKSTQPNIEVLDADMEAGPPSPQEVYAEYRRFYDEAAHPGSGTN